MSAMNETAKHVIAYCWDDFVPAVLLYDSENNSVEKLDLSYIDFSASKEKTCVGKMEDDEYVPCPQQVKLTKNATCLRCSSPSIPVVECIFEPRCTGERCSSPPFCTRPHVVYLALYSNLIKVGMTSERRFKQRITEQGADAASMIFKCENRLEARKLEKEVSERFKIPQDIKPGILMKQWVSAPSMQQMQNVYSTYLQKISCWRKPLNNELAAFDKYPISVRPKSPPKIVRCEGRHTGEVMGIKGRFLVYSTAKGARALDLSDLVGRTIFLNVNNDSK